MHARLAVIFLKIGDAIGCRTFLSDMLIVLVVRLPTTASDRWKADTYHRSQMNSLVHTIFSHHAADWGRVCPSTSIHTTSRHISFEKSQPLSLQLLQNGFSHIDCEALCLHQPARDWFVRRHLFIGYIAHTAHAQFRQWGRSAAAFHPYRQIYRPIIGTWAMKL